jgi:hypothetical protein
MRPEVIERHARGLHLIEHVLEGMLDETAGTTGNAATNYRVGLWDARAAVQRAVAALETKEG